MALLLVDVSNIIYRAYHSLDPTRFQRDDGLSTNAVYGVAIIILNVINTIKLLHDQVTVVACMDSSSCSHTRKVVSSSYKQNRPKAPDQLRHQFKWIRTLLTSMGIHQCEVSGQEADDIIASYVSHHAKLFSHTYIASPDKDMCQLVDNNVSIYNTRTKLVETPKEIKQKYGISPQMFPLFQALVGDKVDNVHGIKGIGPKTGQSVVNACNGSIDELFSDEFSHPKKHLIVNNKETVVENIKLVKLNSAIDVALPAASFSASQLKTQQFKTFLDSMNIHAKALRKYAA